MSLIYYTKVFPKKRKLGKRSAVFVTLTAILILLLVREVSAKVCTPIYGGGQECVYNKRFSLVKDVKIKGEADDRFRDKVGNIEPEENIVFQITVKNTGDREVKKVEIKDSLPKEIKLTAGETEWEIENFKPGEEAIFSFDARVADEDKLGPNKEICVVNKAELYYEDVLENADTATVCINTPVITPIAKVTELPKDGANLAFDIYLLISFIATGFVFRRFEE